ncbi:glycosyltransferase [Methylobacterium oryzisoli]|uniref:glycosyltransferase n=1 Tax=Methylobacterium oryzisoli TaxID=3385502 RepID=UPI0038917444
MRFAGTLARVFRRPIRIGPGFEPHFYAKLYPDLRQLGGEEALFRHYRRHGVQEGRHPTVASYLAAVTAEHGALPADFSVATYRTLNPDLAASLTEDWEFEAHYLQHGRGEERRYRLDLSDLEEEFRAMMLARDEADDLDAFLERHGLAAGAWLLRFNLGQFLHLNADWLGTPPTTRAEGIRLFAEAGVDRLAPFSIDDLFDPAFYRSAYPVEPGLDDVALYRHWLRTGHGRDWMPNEAARLSGLIGATMFPACFDAAAYRAALPAASRIAEGCRTAILQHWLDVGFKAGITAGIDGPGAADLYAAVGRREWLRGEFALSLRAYDEALRRGGPTAGRLHGRGEALRALGDLPGAAAAYREAVRHSGAGGRSHIWAAKCLASSADLAGALAQVRESSGTWLRDARWREVAAAILRQAFEARSAEARAAYREGTREAGDRIVAEALEQLTRDWPLAAPLPAALPPPAGTGAGAGEVVMLANLDLPQCVHYRVEQRRRQLEHAGWRVRVFGQHETDAFREALHGAGAALVYRVPAFPDVVHALLYARALGVRTIYDIDDLIFDRASFPPPVETYEGQITADDYVGLLFGVPLFRFAMSLCDEGLASTPVLAEAMRAVVRSGRCHVLRNGLDQRNDPYLHRPERAPAAPQDPVTLFYGSGTKAHNQDFSDLAGPALLAVLARHPQARLVIAGHLKLDPAFARFGPRVRQLGFTATVTDYWEVLSGVDINLAVLLPGPAADAKSEIKWLEAAMCGIPSVVSGTRTYREILTDGVDALLADTPQDWTDALERLVADPGLRWRVGAAARRKALDAYTLEAARETLARVLPRPGDDPVAPRRAEPSRTKPRLLLVNVFFPPQTIGGATRVVRDNLDHILDRAGDRFDLAVAASDEGVVPAGRARIDAYRGMPVLRLSTPDELNMDWRPLNPAIGELFGAFLDRFAPDLIHFHCVQRLTASVLAEAQARAIPHLVTVHDGWWLSDHQFLLDRDGRVVTPTPDTLVPEAAPVRTAMDGIVRRRRLGRLLHGTDRILAVSETFARIYREAGFPQTFAVPNGLSPLAVSPRTPSPTPRVRLGHVGGREAHKGLPLIEAVLRRSPFQNLSLTAVDLARPAGFVGEEVWGTTPVRIVGPVPQGEIARLYGDLDVLLVPSLWPESFGLVAREARAFGLWVVASDRGAMGEDVEPGTDGFVVDVTTPEPLRAVLARIDADPARFREPPQRTRPIRSAAEQGDDLLALYDEILGETSGERPETR